MPAPLPALPRHRGDQCRRDGSLLRPGRRPLQRLPGLLPQRRLLRGPDAARHLPPAALAGARVVAGGRRRAGVERPAPRPLFNQGGGGGKQRDSMRLSRSIFFYQSTFCKAEEILFLNSLGDPGKHTRQHTHTHKYENKQLCTLT